MTSVDRPKEVYPGKSEEKDFDKHMENRLIKLERTTNLLERNLNRLVEHINKTPARLIGPPNPPAYVS